MASSASAAHSAAVVAATHVRSRSTSSASGSSRSGSSSSGRRRPSATSFGSGRRPKRCCGNYGDGDPGGGGGGGLGVHGDVSARMKRDDHPFRTGQLQHGQVDPA